MTQRGQTWQACKCLDLAESMVIIDAQNGYRLNTEAMCDRKAATVKGWIALCCWRHKAPRN